MDNAGVPVWLYPALFTTTLGLVGWLLKRAIDVLDKKLDELVADVKETRHTLANRQQALELKQVQMEGRLMVLEREIDRRA